ncbi:thiosulfate sulfurtransferase [Mergibacter septicus]|uniref:Thiosulfate sulfurtransferase GlpE n=1 Tax=Mergibacter septicus TaxID=221402 RepID=A0A8D4IUZ3_9PAST|nr:thiosulfate sulfurtransferase GlpE [Mergibacter septicus]AWX14288.1 thiosulfate sulfurtransferase [Mergibacter septicus]AWX16243.1 thiosulfate sulfurtransferase [Mergibacter septicus]QDJ13703.1 thiosulfate sulfurtransferase [Mergibacter septicus]QDJ15495.1 thiosulfate sulfurtransferase [Mergibacter septicus]UTU48635.1 thiosulfate sulfurtransferase GlpE [Mergibacter septicus]
MQETFTEISPEQAWQMLQDQQAVLLDIRDLPSFNLKHPVGAFHLTNETFNTFSQQYDFEFPLIVSCYHGKSSRNVAQYLVEQGYDQVYSLTGGFEAWLKAQLPIESHSSESN